MESHANRCDRDLRKALTSRSGDDPIRTVRGAGYAFDDTRAKNQLVDNQT